MEGPFVDFPSLTAIQRIADQPMKSTNVIKLIAFGIVKISHFGNVNKFV